MMYTETTHGKKERENKPPRERERKSPSSLLCIYSVLNVCVYKYRETSLFVRFRFSDSFLLERRFLSLFSILFFSLSFAFKNLVFSFFLFTHNRQFTFRHIYIQTHLPTYSFFLSFFVCASTCEDSFFYREIETFSGSR